MQITITSRPNNIFHRPERVEVFTDDGGSYEAAVRHIELLIANEHDFACKITTLRRELVDSTLEEVGTAGLVSLNAEIRHAAENSHE